MKDKPLVSVILLNYNSKDMIYGALDSILKQSYEKIQLIVADDGSRDFDKEAVREFINEKKKPNLTGCKILSGGPNKGTVKNLNNGIGSCNGEIIMNLAADDEFNDEHVVGKVVDFFSENHKCLIATGKRNIYDFENRRSLGTEPLPDQIKCIRDMAPEELYQRLLFGNIISGASTAYTRKLFDKFGSFDERYQLLEDLPMYLRLLRQKVKIFFMDFEIVKYRTTGGISASIGQHPKVLEDYETIMKKEVESHPEFAKGIYRKAFEFAILVYKRQKPDYFKYLDVYLFKIYKRIKKAVFKRF